MTPEVTNRSQTSMADCSHPPGSSRRSRTKPLDLGPNLFECPAKLVARVLGEAGDPHVADAVAAFEQVVPRAVGLPPVANDRLFLDHCPHDLHLDGLALPFVEDGKRDGLTGLAAHQLGGVGDRETLRAAAVDSENPVAGEDPGLLGRRADQRTVHRQLTHRGIEPDLDPHAAEFLIDQLVELRHVAGADEVGVVVQLADHAIHRPLEEVLLPDRLQGVPLDQRHGVDQDAAVAIRRHLVVAGQRDDGDRKQQDQIPSWHRRSSMGSRWKAPAVWSPPSYYRPRTHPGKGPPTAGDCRGVLVSAKRGVSRRDARDRPGSWPSAARQLPPLPRPTILKLLSRKGWMPCCGTLAVDMHLPSTRSKDAPQQKRLRDVPKR